MRNICGMSMSMVNGLRHQEENLQPVATPHLQILGPISILYLWQCPPQGFLQKSGVEKVEQNDHHNQTGWLRTFLVTGMGRSPGCCDYVWIFQMQIRFLTVMWICSSCLLNNINAMSKLFHIPTMLNLISSHSHLATLHLIVCQLGFAHLFCFSLVYLTALHQQHGAVNQIAVCQPRHQWFANEMFLINLRPPPRPSRLTLKHTGNVDPQICCRIFSECVRS